MVPRRIGVIERVGTLPSRAALLAFVLVVSTGAQAQVAGEATAQTSPAAVADMVAPMTDAEVRRRLIEELESGTAPAADPMAAQSGLSMHLLGGIQDVSMRFETEYAAIRDSLGGAGDEFRIMLRNLTGAEGWPAVFSATGVFLLMIAAGAAAEFALGRATAGVRGRIRTVESGDTAHHLVYSVNRLLFSSAGLVVFSLVAYLTSLGFFQRFDPLRVLTITWLFVIVLVRFTRVALDFLLPASGSSSLLRLSAETARVLRLCALLMVGLVSLLFLHGSLLVILGISVPLHRAYSLAAGAIVFVLAMLLTWRTRRAVAEAWLDNSPAAGGSVARVWARSWHIPAMVLITATWLLWDMNVVLGRSQSAGAALSLLLAVVAGALVRLLLNAFANRGRDVGHDAGHSPVPRRFAVPRMATSIVFGLLAVSFLVEAVGGRLYAWLSTDTGGAVLKGTFSIAVTLIIAWVLWELIRSAIDRHLPEEDEGPAMAFDGEGGEGAPASRAETLLPLLRGFLQFVLVVLVALTTLSTLGVEIGPLLAGAGVVGLAVGFGAQKLVQDVISGIFFLVDDAFRTGEYIETAGMRGTVEKISVRSLRLRHHLGPVQTIPYGEMATVKNHSRDYIIMKLPFRLPFDTDIEKVRKIIKRIGQDMLEDPELGPGFLAPLKSQGVLEMDDSALVLRMKFTARPGEQWVIRREAYRRVRDALREEGIEFAHRRVTVHLPPDASGTARERAIGAAALAAEATVPPAGLKDEDKR